MKPGFFQGKKFPFTPKRRKKSLGSQCNNIIDTRHDLAAFRSKLANVSWLRSYKPTQPRAIPTAENPTASGCTPDGNHTTVKGTLQKSKIVSPDLGQHRGGLLTTKGDVNSPVVGQRPCQVTMVGKGNGHLAPRFPPTRQPIPPHNDPQLSFALPGVLEVRNNGIKGKYIVKKVLQGPLRKDRDAICVHGNL